MSLSGISKLGIALILNFSIAESCRSNRTLIERKVDTIIYASSLTPFTFTSRQDKIVVPLKISKEIFDPGINYKLQFDSINVELTAEGIYEVYLMDQLIDSVLNQSTLDTTFVGLLDLYQLTIPNSLPSLKLELKTEIIHQIMRNQPKELIVLIQFKGNILTNGFPAKHTGMINCKRISLVNTMP